LLFSPLWKIPFFSVEEVKDEVAINHFLKRAIEINNSKKTESNI
jgi:hypothetical protein